MLEFVIVAGTLIGLYRQLRLQAAAAAIEQVNRMAIEWASERRTRYKYASCASTGVSSTH
jgi:hypothetical protein